MASNRDHHSSEMISITLHRMPRQAWRKALSPRQANHSCRPMYVPGAGGSFHATLQATSDMYLYCNCLTLWCRFLHASCVLPKKTLAVAREKRGQEHILRVVRLIICATDETEAVWAPEATAVIILGGAAVQQCDAVLCSLHQGLMLCILGCPRVCLGERAHASLCKGKQLYPGCVGRCMFVSECIGSTMKARRWEVKS